MRRKPSAPEGAAHSAPVCASTPHQGCSRRRFLEASALAGGALVLGAGGLGASCADVTPPTLSRDVTIALADHPELAVVGGQIALPNDLTGYGFPIYVRRLDEVAFLALGGWCSHEGCTVHTSGDAFRCPCHNTRFDPSGEVTSGPAPDPMPRIDAALDGDTLTLLGQET